MPEVAQAGVEERPTTDDEPPRAISGKRRRGKQGEWICAASPPEWVTDAGNLARDVIQAEGQPPTANQQNAMVCERLVAILLG